MKHALLLILFSLGLLLQATAGAGERITLELDTGTAMTVERFPGDGDTLLIWYPSWRGLGDSYAEVASALAVSGFSVWALDLHDTYMAARSKHVWDEFDHRDLIGVLDEARAKGRKRILIMAGAHGARVALEIAHAWQEKHPKDHGLLGLVLIHPHLITAVPQMGRQAAYVPIAHASNLPIYLLQPQYSTKFLRTQEIARVLGEGGSPVFIQNLLGVQGAFHMRKTEDLSPADHRARKRFPGLLRRFAKIAGALPKVGLPPIPEAGGVVSKGGYEPTLQPYKGNPVAPELKLTTLDGAGTDLTRYRGKTVLINFWASWCGPCVREIPSLRRLNSKLSEKGLEVLAVNIGEPRARIKDFLKLYPVNFPVLLDEGGRSVRGWRVYAFPSNFLVDPNGRITHAFSGALEWDSDRVVQTIAEALKANREPAEATR